MTTMIAALLIMTGMFSLGSDIKKAAQIIAGSR